MLRRSLAIATMLAAASLVDSAASGSDGAGGMVALSGGTFAMGSDAADASPNEKPVHPVTVRPFRLDRTEVTVGQARACVVRGVCPAPPSTTNPACTFAKGDDDQPLNCVTWTYADAFCRATGKRLPTEAEWEWAAHAAGRGSHPWGHAPPTCELAVTLVGPLTATSCSPGGPAAVGTHPRGGSRAGVQDLAGNVEEWVADWYADHYDGQMAGATPRLDPKGPPFGVAHVLRGGGWQSSPREARASARNWGSLNEAGGNVGFRCAKD